jgi:hypothetical protein
MCVNTNTVLIYTYLHRNRHVYLYTYTHINIYIYTHIYIYVQAAYAGLSEPENASLPQTRAKISQVFQFYLTHSIHAHSLIRATSLR